MLKMVEVPPSQQNIQPAAELTSRGMSSVFFGFGNLNPLHPLPVIPRGCMSEPMKAIGSQWAYHCWPLERDVGPVWKPENLTHAL